MLQCPHKQKGKKPAINIITVEVPEVTTRSKAKTAEWEEKDEIRKAVQEWVTKANAVNIERMLQDVTLATTDAVTPSDIDPIWQALADCPITLTMSKLLSLVSQFRKAMESSLQIPHKVIPSYFTEPTHGPTIIDYYNPAIKVLVQGTEITGCVVVGGSGVNVISKATCTNLGITSWENFPFWLRMADTRSVRPLGLLRKLSVIIGGHLFEILAVVQALEFPRVYPLLLGRPWLRSANIKQNWQHNHLSFRKVHAKVGVPMEEITPAPKEISPLYAEENHMLEGLEDKELERYLDENPRIVPLFEIDVGETAESYASPIRTTGHDDEPGEDAIAELCRTKEAFEREMEISRRVAATELEEINVGRKDDLRNISIDQNLPPTTRTTMIALL